MVPILMMGYLSEISSYFEKVGANSMHEQTIGDVIGGYIHPLKAYYPTR